MKTEKEIEMQIKHIQDFISTEIYRVMQTDEGKAVWLDRLKLLKWVLE